MARYPLDDSHREFNYQLLSTSYIFCGTFTDILTNWMVYLGCQSVNFPLLTSLAILGLSASVGCPTNYASHGATIAVGRFHHAARHQFTHLLILTPYLPLVSGSLAPKFGTQKRNKSKTSRLKTWRITKHQRDQSLWRTPQRKRVHQKQEPCFKQRTGYASVPPPFPPDPNATVSRHRMIWTNPTGQVSGWHL